MRLNTLRIAVFTFRISLISSIMWVESFLGASSSITLDKNSFMAPAGFGPEAKPEGASLESPRVMTSCSFFREIIL